jgi:BON domain
MRRKPKNMLAITLGAVGAGAGLMFLLDPDRGGKRRGFIGGKAVRFAKLFGKNAEERGGNLGSHAYGVAAAEKSDRLAKETVADEVLAERLRLKIRPVVTHPRAISVTVGRGVVELRGAVLRSERRRAIRVAESVRGVRGVQHDALITYSDEQRMPSFQPRSLARELGQAKPTKRFRTLRLGLALASGVIAGYKAFQGTYRPRQRHFETTPARASDVAAA